MNCIILDIDYNPNGTSLPQQDTSDRDSFLRQMNNLKYDRDEASTFLSIVRTVPSGECGLRSELPLEHSPATKDDIPENISGLLLLRHGYTINTLLIAHQLQGQG